MKTRIQVNTADTREIHEETHGVSLFQSLTSRTHFSLFLSHSITQILEGDQILSVDGFETFGKPIKTVAEMFVGDEGSSVKLLMSRPGSQ